MSQGRESNDTHTHTHTCACVRVCVCVCVLRYCNDKAQRNDQLAAAQKAMGHSTKSKVEDLRAYCQAKRIPYASSASKLVMCKAILA